MASLEFDYEISRRFFGVSVFFYFCDCFKVLVAHLFRSCIVFVDVHTFYFLLLSFPIMHISSELSNVVQYPNQKIQLSLL